MPSYSTNSRNQLDTVDLRLQRVFERVIIVYDHTIIEGHRPKEKQNEAFNSGNSQVQWPNSDHNYSPSRAVDVAPYIPGIRIPWPHPGQDDYIKRMMQFTHFAGWVQATGKEMGIDIGWGGDWDRDHSLLDNNFDDLVHFYLLHP